MTEKKGWRIGTALVFVLCLPLLMAGPGYSTHLDPGKNDGCTFRFWKNNQGAWGPTGYSPDQTLSSVGFVFPASLSFLEGVTLLGALNFPGGRTLARAAEGLMREAVAGLLNAAHPGVVYPVEDTRELIMRVNQSLATGRQENLLNTTAVFEFWNGLGCPLR